VYIFIFRNYKSCNGVGPHLSRSWCIFAMKSSVFFFELFFIFVVPFFFTEVELLTIFFLLVLGKKIFYKITKNNFLRSGGVCLRVRVYESTYSKPHEIRNHRPVSRVFSISIFQP